MFGRATITLGIGPHSSIVIIANCCKVFPTPVEINTITIILPGFHYYVLT